MKLSTDFKTQIANAFYDKEVETYTVEDTTDDEGWGKQVATLNSTFNGNLKFNNFEQLQKDFGLDLVIDIAITCLPDTDVDQGFILGYGDQLYKAIKCLTFDSHKLIIGQKWLLKSSISISA